MRAQWVKAADGCELWMDLHGEPTDRLPVVCIPGLTRNARDFTRLAESLGLDRLVVAVDLRGRGRSGRDPSAESYRLDVYVEDLFSIVDALSVGPAIVIGTSLGGMVAMRMGAAAPARVAGLVLNDIGPDVAPEGAARIASYAGHQPAVGTWEEAVAQTRLVSETALPGLSDEAWRAEAAQRYRQAPDGRVVPDYDPGITAGPPSSDDPWWVFHALSSIPLLVVRGALSDVLAPETVTLMAAMHPTMEALEVPGRGHVPLLHEPLAEDAVRRFLSALDRRDC